MQRVPISNASILRFLRGWPNDVPSSTMKLRRPQLRDFQVRYEEHCADVERAAKSPLQFAGVVQPRASKQHQGYPPFYQRVYEREPAVDSQPPKRPERPQEPFKRPTPAIQESRPKNETRHNK
eukprot:TRINITY_DN56_c0_g1_i1.p1 TRINITY_DN56_c0_g1~~TRINITY_DN56_c0_g1_i1.p1  ORF type:complete len:123 (-),score=17.51 TRINITY_DN56_c0_g1_i1:161-529(-)